jgi:hypothetical protein
LAAEFHSAFGKLPTIGDGSPFTKYCRAAFEQHGFRPISTTKMRAVLDQVSKSARTAELKT